MNLTAGMVIFRGLNFETNEELGQKGHLWTGINYQQCSNFIQLLRAFSSQGADSLTHFDMLHVRDNSRISLLIVRNCGKKRALNLRVNWLNNAEYAEKLYGLLIRWKINRKNRENKIIC